LRWHSIGTGCRRRCRNSGFAADPPHGDPKVLSDPDPSEANCRSRTAIVTRKESPASISLAPLSTKKGRACRLFCPESSCQLKIPAGWQRRMLLWQLYSTNLEMLHLNPYFCLRLL